MSHRIEPIAYPGTCLCGCGGITRIAKSHAPGKGVFKGYPLPYIKGHSPRDRAARSANPPPRRTRASVIGEANLNWRGGVWIDKFGYRWVHQPDHPHHNKHYVLQHRLVMEQHLGRFLDPKEKVHHRNHDRLDNRIENLEVMSQREHAHIHLSQKRKPQSLETREATRERVRRIWAERRAGLRPWPKMTGPKSHS